MGVIGGVGFDIWEIGEERDIRIHARRGEQGAQTALTVLGEGKRLQRWVRGWGCLRGLNIREDQGAMKDDSRREGGMLMYESREVTVRTRSHLGQRASII